MHGFYFGIFDRCCRHIRIYETVFLAIYGRQIENNNIRINTDFMCKSDTVPDTKGFVQLMVSSPSSSRIDLRLGADFGPV